MRTLLIAITVLIALAIAIVVAVRLPVEVAPPPPAPPLAAPEGETPERPAREELPLSPEVRLGLPDCPDAAGDDLRSADALECWFADGTFGPWHMVSSLEIQGITITRLMATDPGVAGTVARRLVEQGGSGVEEVLVYAKPLRGAGVTRVRWTPDDGYHTSVFGDR